MTRAGLRVLDLSQFLPGQIATQMMADHGAEVIRIEPPAGETVRNVGYRQNGQSVWFRNTHRGKKSLVLNLKDAADKSAFLHLAATADVVVEAFRPDMVDRLGLGYATVSAINPGISMPASRPLARTARCATPLRMIWRSRRWPAWSASI